MQPGVGVEATEFEQDLDAADDDRAQPPKAELELLTRHLPPRPRRASGCRRRPPFAPSPPTLVPSSTEPSNPGNPPTPSTVRGEFHFAHSVEFGHPAGLEMASVRVGVM